MNDPSNQEVDLATLAALLNKAHRSLSAARLLAAQGDRDFAISRVYYAAFYAVEAILHRDGLSFSSHSAVISQFNRLYIKTAIFPKGHSKSLQRLFRDRQRGDYEPSAEFRDEQVSANLADAGELIRVIEANLRKPDAV